MAKTLEAHDTLIREISEGGYLDEWIAANLANKDSGASD
mgnify:CR=1 FL=1